MRAYALILLTELIFIKININYKTCTDAVFVVPD